MLKSLIPDPVSGRVKFLPLAISLSIWAAYLQAGLPFHAPDNALLHNLDLATGWSGGGAFLSQFILMLLVGTFWQSFARCRWDSQPSRSWSFYLGVALILAILFISLNHGATVRYELWSITGLIAGLVLGSIVGWFAAFPLATWVQASARGLPALWAISVFAALVLALLPLDTKATLSQTAFTHWNILDRVYQLLKPSILWGALGLICGFSGYGRQARVWGGAFVFGFVVCAFLAAENFRFEDVVEVMALLPGLAMGLWLGERSRLTDKFTQAKAASSTATSPLAAANLGRAVSPTASADKLRIESNLRDGDSASHDGQVTPPLRASVENKSRYLSQEAADSPPRPLSNAALLARRAVALIVIGAAGWALLDFPRWNVPLAGGFVLYLALLWRYPKAWLVIVPAALPVLDLAFWTGRFFLDEFDLLLAVTLAALLWRKPVTRTNSRHAAPLILATLLMASVLISGLTGLLPLQLLDANAFTSYFSQYNSLRVAKGFLWGIVFYAMLRPHLNELQPMKLLSAGMLIGLAGVAISALWEYWRFSGSSAPDYRVTATFSSMHTGGGHIEAYLVFALPFAWALLLQEKKIWIRAAALSVFLLAIYALITTVARGGILALVVVFAVLALGVYRTLRARGMSHNLRYTASAVLIAGVLLVIAGLSSATFLQHRFTQTETDAQTRFAHWTHALGLLQNNWGERLFGAGLGTFPGRYFYANFDSSLGNYRYQTEGSNRYLSLNSGGTLYMAQSVTVMPDTPYTLELDVRSNDQTKQLDVPICEKKLLNSHLCQWLSVPVTPGQGWQHRSIAFSSDQVGQGAWWAKRPVQLSIYNPQDKGVVDVDNIRLLDRSGVNLISNGDFTQGGDYWFFKSGDHLPWHIKNMWVHLAFEQGLVGLAIFCALIIAAVWRLMRGFWAGEPLATVWLAAISGLLTIGVVDSLLDAPRLAMLLVLALLAGASHNVRRDPNK